MRSGQIVVHNQKKVEYPLAELVSKGAELRVVPSLWPLRMLLLNRAYNTHAFGCEMLSQENQKPKHMKTDSIRFRAAALFMHKGNILVHESENRNTGETWFVPPGGGVEYGESSLHALKREIKEELGWNIKDEKLIGAFESFHVINEIEEHEISFVYLAAPENSSVFNESEFRISEDNGTRKIFTWKGIPDLAKPGSLLYPKGLLEKIETNINDQNN